MNRTPTLLALPLLGALLVACGGTDVPAGAANAEDRTDVAAASSVSWPVAPLVADDGSIMPSVPQAIPTDPGTRTRAGRYATPAQAEQLARTLGQRAVRVAVLGGGDAAVKEGADQVYGMLGAMNLPASAPVLVEGADPRAAAAVVDLLAANGVANSWLVTQ